MFGTLGLVSAFAAAASVPLFTSADHIQACTMEYAPVCGMTLKGTEETFGNRCALESAHARFLHTGECRTAGGGSSPGYPGAGTGRPGGTPGIPPDRGEARPLPPQPDPDTGSDAITPPSSCVIWFDGCNTCRKSSDGTWACTLMGCFERARPYCKKHEGSPTPNVTLPPLLDRLPVSADGVVSNLPYEPAPECRAWYDGCNSCRRSENGTAACTRRFCTVFESGYCTDPADSTQGTSSQPRPALLRSLAPFGDGRAVPDVWGRGGLADAEGRTSLLPEERRTAIMEMRAENRTAIAQFVERIVSRLFSWLGGR